MKTYSDMALQAVREAWECNLPIVYESPIYKYGTQLVITTQKIDKLDNPGTKYPAPVVTKDVYTCYRYFRINDSWQVSIDRNEAHLKETFDWLAINSFGQELQK